MLIDYPKSPYGSQFSRKFSNEPVFRNGESQIWTQVADGKYKFVAIYLGKLLLTTGDPEHRIGLLASPAHNLQYKGNNNTDFHLRADADRDPDETLLISPRRYVEGIVELYKRFFRGKPSECGISSLLGNNVRPGFDTLDFEEETTIRKHQGLIGQLQWTISIGRFIIYSDPMTRFNFSAAPGVGLLSRLKQIDGYICEFKHYRTRSRPGESKCTKIQDNGEGWDYIVCKDAEEILPDDAPTVNGERMAVNSRLDTNFMHNILSCKACTDTLHLFNGISSKFFTEEIDARNSNLQI